MFGAQKNMTGKKENSSQREYQMFSLQSGCSLREANMFIILKNRSNSKHHGLHSI
jgi:hypothetical protein